MNWATPRTFLKGLAIATALTTAAVALPVQAATLRMAWSQDATGLDPHKQTAFSSLRLLELIYEPLVRLDAELNVVPAIATTWEFAEDAKTLTFNLDPNAKFSNGAQVTSADVKASFERLLNEETAAAARSNFLSIASIDTPDDVSTPPLYRRARSNPALWAPPLSVLAPSCSTPGSPIRAKC